MQDGEEVWIAKPSLTNQALSICIFDHVHQLRAALEAAPCLREWVLQRQGSCCPCMHIELVMCATMCCCVLGSLLSPGIEAKKACGVSMQNPCCCRLSSTASARLQLSSSMSCWSKEESACFVAVSIGWLQATKLRVWARALTYPGLQHLYPSSLVLAASCCCSHDECAFCYPAGTSPTRCWWAARSSTYAPTCSALAT